MSVEEIRADARRRLARLPEPRGPARTRSQGLKHGICDACFSDEYPVPIEVDEAHAAALAVPAARGRAGRRRRRAREEDERDDGEPDVHPLRAMSGAGRPPRACWTSTSSPGRSRAGDDRHRGDGLPGPLRAARRQARHRRLLPRRGRAPRHARLRLPAGLRHGDGPDARLRASRAGRRATATCTACRTSRPCGAPRGCRTHRARAVRHRARRPRASASRWRRAPSCAASSSARAARGLVAKMGSELEFFLFRGDYRAARARRAPRPRERPAATSRTTTSSRAASSRT